MALPNAKNKIIEHYDVVSPYYYKLWGEHLHHGYWIRGDESKEQAQQQLIEHFSRPAKIPRGRGDPGRRLRLRRQQPLSLQTIRPNIHRHYHLPGAGRNG